MGNKHEREGVEASKGWTASVTDRKLRLIQCTDIPKIKSCLSYRLQCVGRNQRLLQMIKIEFDKS